MTTYKGINGFAVQSVATDPSPLDEGQVWYNNATYAFKLASVTTAGTWASGGNLNTARDGVGGFGTQTSALAFGGDTPPVTTATELYNGTSWTNNPTGLNTARLQGASSKSAPQTAGIFFGGYNGTANVTASESWNGTTWTNTPSINSSRRVLGGIGTQTASLAFAGYVGPATTTATESWNGTSWTTVNSLPFARMQLGGAGLQTAGLAFAGTTTDPTTFSASTESWNGTSWSNVPGGNINTQRSNLAGFGSQTSALAAGGLTSTSPTTGATELWNGTTWTSNPNNMATARNNLGGTGTQSLGLVFGAGSPGNATEEFTGPGSPVTKTITTS